MVDLDHMDLNALLRFEIRMKKQPFCGSHRFGDSVPLVTIKCMLLLIE